MMKMKRGRPPLPEGLVLARAVALVPRSLLDLYKARQRELGYRSLAACLAAALEDWCPRGPYHTTPPAATPRAMTPRVMPR